MIISLLRIKDDIIAPLQSAMVDTDVEQFQHDVLHEIEQTNATGLVMDISAMDIVDSYMARVLNETMSMASLMGASVVVVGMQPAVALTLVEMGRGLIGVETALDLEQGLDKLREIKGREAGGND